MSKEEFILHEFEKFKIIEKGHFILSSGKHTDTYINKSKIFSNARLSNVISTMLAREICELKNDFHFIVSPAIGGIIIGALVASKFAITHFVWTERNKDGIMELRRHFIPDNYNVVIVDDVITTGLSIQETMDAIKTKVNIVGIACIVNRSDMVNYKGIPIISLLDYYTPLYRENELPEDLKLLPAVKPGSR